MEMETIAPILEAANDHPYLTFASVVLGCAALVRLARWRSRSHFPPGPKGYPIVGNLFDLPPTHVWKKFGELGNRYGVLPSLNSSRGANLDAYRFAWVGEIAYLNVMGQEMVILNSTKAAVDLLDKRSATYSDRPVVMMCGEIIGWNKSLALTQYGSRFREFRKYMNKLFGSRASVEKFFPLQERETAKFVAKVAADPGSLFQQIRK